MENKKTISQWHNNDVLLVCEDTNYYNMIREILRPMKWMVHLPASDAQSARERLLAKTFAAHIVIESKKIPATEVLRVLFQSDRGRLTPTLVLTNFTEPLDIQIFKTIFSVTVISKPLVPIKIISAFKEMITFWENPALYALRHIAHLQEIKAGETTKIGILEKLAFDTQASPFAIQAIITLMMQQNLFREAEKKLLDHFRSNPQNPAILAQCAWFYLDSHAPYYALKFLTKLKQMAPKSVIFNFDLAIGHLASGRLDQALVFLKEWNDYFPGNPVVESFLARLIIAEGLAEKEVSFGIPQSSIKRAQEKWQVFEPQQVSSETAKTREIKAS